MTETGEKTDTIFLPGKYFLFATFVFVFLNTGQSNVFFMHNSDLGVDEHILTAWLVSEVQ